MAAAAWLAHSPLLADLRGAKDSALGGVFVFFLFLSGGGVCLFVSAFLCYFCLAGPITNRYGELRQTKAIGQNGQVELLCGTERLQDEKRIVDPLPHLARQGGGKLLVPTSVIQRNLPLSSF